MAYQKGLIRLDKAIADQTGYSRKDVHKLLSKGQVLVNGAAVRNFDAKVYLEHDIISVNCLELALKKYSYIMMNKPKGVVCATADEKLPTVIDLLPEAFRRRGLFPAGRLDKDTEGFVLLTNDGQTAHRLLAPRSHVPKQYTVWLDKPVEEGVEQAFAKGMEIPLDKHDNRPGGAGARIKCSPARLERTEQPQVVRVEIRQGMYHQVKRMFASMGYLVVGLRRDSIGGVALDPALAPGESRELDAAEMDMLGIGK